MECSETETTQKEKRFLAFQDKERMQMGCKEIDFMNHYMPFVDKDFEFVNATPSICKKTYRLLACCISASRALRDSLKEDLLGCFCNIDSPLLCFV